MMAAARGAPLQIRDASFDWSLSTLLLHHFDRAGAELLLAEMARVARRGVVVTDLKRAFATSVGARLLPLLGVGGIAAADGRASAAQAWKLAEVAELARAHRVVELEPCFPFRFSLVIEPR